MILGTLFEQTGISLPKGCSILNINAFWLVVLEKKIFKHFPIYYYVKV